MSWRTQGNYQGLSASEIAWLKNFDRQWDQKSEGRSQTDAMDFIVKSDGVEQRGVLPEENGPTALEALLITSARQIARVAIPRAAKNYWFIPMVLLCGKRTRAFFSDYESASQAYLAICEFLHWFQPVSEGAPKKQQRSGSRSPQSEAPLTVRQAAKSQPREKGSTYLDCTPQTSPSYPQEPPSPLSRSRLA